MGLFKTVLAMDLVPQVMSWAAPPPHLVQGNPIPTLVPGNPIPTFGSRQPPLPYRPTPTLKSLLWCEEQTKRHLGTDYPALVA